MRTTALHYASHVAHLDPLAGNGALVMPDLCQDMTLGLPTLHEAGWDHVVRDLGRLGWELSEGEDGLPASVGVTHDGREALVLYGRESITSKPSIAEHVESFAVLRQVAGVL
jgi:hypothetical protein